MRLHSSRGIALRSLTFLFLGALVLSCNESLPPRNDPRVVFTGVIRPVYIYDWNENDILIRIGLVNAFDETIQDTAAVQGTFRIASLNTPSLVRTMRIPIDSLVSGSLYNAASRMFTVDPGDTVWFRARWDWIDDNGLNLTTDNFRYNVDPSCGGRQLANEEAFSFSGSLQLTRHTGTTALPATAMSVCFVTPYASPRVCPKPPSVCAPHE